MATPGRPLFVPVNIGNKLLDGDVKLFNLAGQVRRRHPGNNFITCNPFILRPRSFCKKELIFKIDIELIAKRKTVFLLSAL